MLKVGGIWVSPAEIEHLLMEHPAVQACGVTGREDQDHLIKPVAHVVLRPGHEPDAELVGGVAAVRTSTPFRIQAATVD